MAGINLSVNIEGNSGSQACSTTSGVSEYGCLYWEVTGGRPPGTNLHLVTVKENTCVECILGNYVESEE